MKYVPNAVSRKVALQVLKTQKASPTLLFGLGIVGFGATVVLACKATLKFEDHVEKVQGELDSARSLAHSERISDSEKNKTVAYIYASAVVDMTRLYAPAIAVGTLSIAALGGSHRILTQRNAALTAAYAVLEKTLREYRERVRTEIGLEREEEVYYSMTKHEVIDANGKRKVTAVGPHSASMYARYFDEASRSYNRNAEANKTFIRCQQLWANDILKARGHLFLNEVYDMLGFERTPAGQAVGWLWQGDGDNYVDFGVFKNDAFTVSRFVNGDERTVLLDFNVDGNIYDKI